MEPTQPKRRIGLIRIDADIWEKHSAAVRQSFSDSMILDTKPNPSTQSVDLVIINSKLDEVDAGSPVPRYSCKIFVSEAGTIKRGELISESLS